MYLIIDVEATCWDSKDLTHKGENEIIEIGAVCLSDKFEFIEEYQTFVIPVKNSTLSDFCTQLTGIKQWDVLCAPAFPTALIYFVNVMQYKTGEQFNKMIFCSWGHYDRKQFEKDCRYHKIEYPFGKHRSLKHEFAERHKIRPCGMVKAMKILGIPLVGTHHRALDDAKNIAKIFVKEWGGNKKEVNKDGSI